MKLKTLLMFTTLLLLTSCATKIPLSKNYFNRGKKVGLIQIEHEITNYREGSQGLLDMALTSGNKYKEPLLVVDKEIKPTQQINDFYKKIYAAKGMDLKIIDTQADFQRLNKFTKPEKSKKKYYKYNIKHLKKKYSVDELLIVDVKYGVMIDYYGFTETGRFGYCNISSEIVDLNDNAYLFKDASVAKIPILGKWKTPPNYYKLKRNIKKAINNAMILEKTKFK